MPELRVSVGEAGRVGGAGERIAELVIDNEGKRNALSPEMWRRLPSLLAELDADDRVSVVVVRGAGAHFSAGAEITELDQILFDPALPPGGLVGAGESALAGFSKPLIAAIDGFCVGAGVGLAAACDLRIASDRSSFAITPAKLGITYPVTGVERLVRVLGVAVTKRLLLTAETVSAAEALRIGLVSEVVPAAVLHARARELAQRMTRLSQYSLRASKEVIELYAGGEAGAGAAASVAAAAAVDAAARWQRHPAAARDYAEGVAAFRESRHPRFDPAP